MNDVSENDGKLSRPERGSEAGKPLTITLPFDLKNLNQRVVTAAILAPVVLGIVWAGGFLYNLLVIAAMMAGMFEWVRLTVKKPSLRLDAVACLGVALVLFAGWIFGFLWALRFLPLIVLGVFYFAQESDPVQRNWMKRALWVAFGPAYLGMSGVALIEIRADDQTGVLAAFYLLAVVWSTDIGAYFAGRAIGGPKLMPKVSPNKTWAGLLGGMLSAGLLGGAVAWMLDDGAPHRAALVALGLAVVSQMGDLFESYIKRRRGVKDSGTLIPGHGGLLDRIDGLLLASIVMFGLLFFRG